MKESDLLEHLQLLPQVLQDRFSSASAAFAEHAQLMSRWSSVHNLTRVDEDRFAVDHYLDCALAFGVVRPHMADTRTIADVGSGPGFPGVVWALLEPNLQVTVYERAK